MILVGDIGGTNARLALARPDGDRIELTGARNYPTPAELSLLVRAYLAERGVKAVSAAALCGAGPLRADGSIALTNHACILEPAEIGAAAGTAKVAVVNDFEAVGHAVPALRPEDLRPCGGTVADPAAPCVVIGAGTGLGMAAVLPGSGGCRVIPGEGGHADLAPVDDEELEAWQRLRREYGRISAETVLAGRGLQRLAAALGAPPGLSPPQVVAAARDGNPQAQAALRLWTCWLGRVAGNAVLALGARGGVYIAGGIVPALGSQFSIEGFRRGFEDKAPFSAWLKAIPSWVITAPEPAFLGLAALALGRFSTEFA
jgi:glucokinase